MASFYGYPRLRPFQHPKFVLLNWMIMFDIPSTILQRANVWLANAKVSGNPPSAEKILIFREEKECCLVFCCGELAALSS